MIFFIYNNSFKQDYSKHSAKGGTFVLGKLKFDKYYPLKNKSLFKEAGSKKFFEDNHVNRKLQNRVQELLFTHNITERELCENLGIKVNTWIRVKKGKARPSHNFIIELSKYLGDEVFYIFSGNYFEFPYPELISADKFEQDILTKRTLERVYLIDKEKGKFRYLS
jgi:transcriptional regulator with XRE-family HTH domain